MMLLNPKQTCCKAETALSRQVSFTPAGHSDSKAAVLDITLSISQRKMTLVPGPQMKGSFYASGPQSTCTTSQKPNDFQVSTCQMLEPVTYTLTHPQSTALSGKIIKTLFFTDNTSHDNKPQEASTHPKMSMRPCLSFDVIHTGDSGRKRKHTSNNQNFVLSNTNKVRLWIQTDQVRLQGTICIKV